MDMDPQRDDSQANGKDNEASPSAAIIAALPREKLAWIEQVQVNTPNGPAAAGRLQGLIPDLVAQYLDAEDAYSASGDAGPGASEIFNKMSTTAASAVAAMKRYTLLTLEEKVDGSEWLSIFIGIAGKDSQLVSRAVAGALQDAPAGDRNKLAPAAHYLGAYLMKQKHYASAYELGAAVWENLPESAETNPALLVLKQQGKYLATASLALWQTQKVPEGYENKAPEASAAFMAEQAQSFPARKELFPAIPASGHSGDKTNDNTAGTQKPRQAPPPGMA